MEKFMNLPSLLPSYGKKDMSSSSLLDSELSKAAKTKEISLSNITLSQEDLTLLTSYIKTNSVRSLSLVNVSLKPDSAFLAALKSSPHLNTINFSTNNLQSTFPDVVDSIKYKKLKSVTFSGSGLTSSDTGAVVELLKLSKSLKKVDFEENELNMKEVISALAHLDLEEVNFSRTNFGNEECKSLTRNMGLKKVKIGFTKATSKGVMKFGTNDLDELDVSGLDLSSVDFKKFSVRKFVLSGSKLGERITSLAGNEAVETLDLSRNGLETEEDVELVVKLLKTCPFVSHLSLKDNRLTTRAVHKLSEYLNSQQSRLVTLDLCEAGLDDESISVLAESLINALDLQNLRLEGNSFGPQGARHLSFALRKCKLAKIALTGQRIGASGQNHIAIALKHRPELVVESTNSELDYMNVFVNQVLKLNDGVVETEGVFEVDGEGALLGWSEEAWMVVKCGVGEIIGACIQLLSEERLKEFKENVVLHSRNVVGQSMFEYVLRHAAAPSIEVVKLFVNKAGVKLDTACSSKVSVAMAKEKRKSDDVTYRIVAKDFSNDPVVRHLAKNQSLYLERYLVSKEYVHETESIKRSVARDIFEGQDVYVQVYKDRTKFSNEVRAREDLKEKMSSSGPMAIYQSILKEHEIHADAGFNESVISFWLSNDLTDLRHAISNLGVTAGFDIRSMVFLAKSLAEKLGNINSLGRIFGDVRPRNFLNVAPERKSTSGSTLEAKWVLFDLGCSVKHGETVMPMKHGYTSPEVAKTVFNGGLKTKALPLAGEKMDVWSFGVVLFYLLTGMPLFHLDSSTDDILRKKDKLELMNWLGLDEKRASLILHRANEAQFESPSTFKKIKASAKDLLMWCLQGDPLNRPTFGQILSHPFFSYKTHVDYTDVDLLLGWYKKQGLNKKLSSQKNNRKHFHVIGCEDQHAAGDVVRALSLGFKEAGCELTTDLEDWKLDISNRKALVEKARAVIVLARKGVVDVKVLKRIIWAMDSPETDRVLFLDISDVNAFTGLETFDMDSYVADLEKDEKKFVSLMKQLSPIEENLGLSTIKYPSFKKHGAKAQMKWLKRFVKETVFGFMFNQVPKTLPYRTLRFQNRAMINELVRRAGFYPPTALNVHSNDAAKNTGKIILMHNGNNRLKNDVASLKSLLKKHGQKPVEVSKPEELYKYISFRDGGFVTTTPVVVFAFVTEGFYKLFQREISLLNKAEGMFSLVPVKYDLHGNELNKLKEEILNLGVSADISKKLMDKKSYVPLPGTKKNLEYETRAAMDYLVTEAEKQVHLVQDNKGRDESNIWIKYEKNNLFKHVY
eukprot:augustus_masked-scaffold_65-processed-gene-0.57-mRNA-1 protein AED:1.00 eAED:1.00 QI:0/-1/0/0/-1/1/1/0/1301